MTNASNATSAHCGTCSCGTVEYGVGFRGGAKDGEVLGPLGVNQIAYWNRNWWSTVYLAARVRPDTTFRPATDEEIAAWNGLLAESIRAGGEVAR